MRLVVYRQRPSLQRQTLYARRLGVVIGSEGEVTAPNVNTEVPGTRGYVNPGTERIELDFVDVTY